MRHPRERSLAGMDRRTFLQRSAAWGALASASGLLAACGGGAGGDGGGSTGIQLASPSNPETLPLSEDNAAIKSGLEPEAGPLKIYNWSEYVYPRVVKDFAAEYGVDYEITSFYNMSEAVNKIRTGRVDFDVFFPTADQVPKLVAAKLLQPVNHDYLGNLKANIWPELADPWYDKGSRYTVPYVVYTTGVAWRTDMVSEDVAAMDNPYEMLWNEKYAGKVGIYDDYREAMTMVMLKNGVSDINTGDPKVIAQVEKELVELSKAVNVKTTIDGAYSRLPEGVFALHQAWSGDIVAGPYYMPGKSYGDPEGVLRYWWPPNGTIGSDMIAIPSGAKNPVLAHHFLNFLLEDKHALKNFSWVGYQPPLKSLKPSKLVSDGYVVPNLKPAIVEKPNFSTGVVQTALPPVVDRRYQDAWSDFKSGA